MYMETHVTLCVPVEDGIDVHCSTQDGDAVQTAIANSLGMPKARYILARFKLNSLSHSSFYSLRVNVQIRRLGGSYGGKISRSTQMAVAAAMAAIELRRPVRIQLDLHTNMAITGGRLPYYCKYKVYFYTLLIIVRADQ